MAKREFSGSAMFIFGGVAYEWLLILISISALTNSKATEILDHVVIRYDVTQLSSDQPRSHARRLAQHKSDHISAQDELSGLQLLSVVLKYIDGRVSHKVVGVA